MIHCNNLELKMRVAIIAALLIIAPTSAIAVDCSDSKSATEHKAGQLLRSLAPKQQVVRMNNSSVVNFMSIDQTCYYVVKGSVRLRKANGVDKDEVFTMGIQYDASIEIWTGSNLMLFDKF